MADSRERISAALTSATTTDDLQLRGSGYVTVLISGTFVATVEIEATRPGGSTYATIHSPNKTAYTYTADALQVIELPGQWDVRANVSAYTSGTVNIELTPYRSKARGV
jgi:hypothetical protein